MATEGNTAARARAGTGMPFTIASREVQTKPGGGESKTVGRSRLNQLEGVS